jgi:hypothetical protein
MPRIPIPLEDERGRERILGLIKALDVTKPWQVTIEPKTKKRTLNQNALYWKWVGLIADATGNDNDDVHEALKAKFLTPRTIDLGGEQREIRSTAKQDKAGMTAFMDRVYAFATSELGLYLPTPEELGRVA